METPWFMNMSMVRKMTMITKKATVKIGYTTQT
jgi:hypothetical protein